MKGEKIVKSETKLSQKKLIHSHLSKNKIKTLHKNIKYKKRQYTTKITKHIIKYSIITSVVYLILLYLIFFVFYIDETENSNINDLKTINEIDQIKLLGNFSTYLDLDSTIPIQPINIIIITSKDPEIIFKDINWERNELFNTDNITLRIYFKLFRNKSLPISTNYLDKEPQDFGFQEDSKSNIKREHIRLWKRGHYNNESNIIYFGSVSYDQGIDFTIYNDFLVPLHEFDPNVDKSRNYLFNKIINQYPQSKYYNFSSNNKIDKKSKEMYKYYSDGNIIVIQIE